jgi:hypothetical protein
VTNAELLDLLREARESVYLHKERLIDCPHELDDCTCDLAAQKVELLYRIDAAHAERQDSATDVVESKTRWWPSHQETVIDGACARVWLQDAENWGWWIFKDHGVRDTGFAKTEVEAKEAAIAAARGLK